MVQYQQQQKYTTKNLIKEICCSSIPRVITNKQEYHSVLHRTTTKLTPKNERTSKPTTHAVEIIDRSLMHTAKSAYQQE